MNKKTAITVIIVILLLAGISIATYAWLSQGTNKPESGTCTTNNGTIERQCTGDYVGLPVYKATDKAESNDLFPKTVVRDGKPQAFNDVGSASIYFEVENGTVIKAYFEQDRE